MLHPTMSLQPWLWAQSLCTHSMHIITPCRPDGCCLILQCRSRFCYESKWACLLHPRKQRPLIFFFRLPCMHLLECLFFHHVMKYHEALENCYTTPFNVSGRLGWHHSFGLLLMPYLWWRNIISRIMLLLVQTIVFPFWLCLALLTFYFKQTLPLALRQAPSM